MTKEIIENDPYKIAGVDIDAGNNLVEKIKKIPNAKPKSPTLLTTKALIAAAFAVSFLNQKPIKKYEQRPTPSQPKNN